MHRVLGLLTKLAFSRAYSALALAALAIIGPAMLPVSWSGNEIVYFDLAYRSVEPDAFTERHAMFDSSNGRIVAMSLIGYSIKALGFEAAKTTLAMGVWVLYALALAAVARGLRMRVVELSIALTAFLIVGQELVGGEWIFGTIEPKVLAYVFVLLAVSAALELRGTLMIVLVAVGTYFHFLVGGAWAVLLILLVAIGQARAIEVVRLLGLYVGLVSPILWILLTERIGVTVDTSVLEGTIDQIYATFRVASHAAPFSSGLNVFGRSWLPGLIMHGALAVLLWWSGYGKTGWDRSLHLWAAGLNLLLPLAAVVAYIDSETHFFAKFLIFRPSALVLLLSYLLLVRSHFPGPDRDLTALAPASLLLISAFIVPEYLKAVGAMVYWAPPSNRLEAQMSEEERYVLHWIQEETAVDSAILVEPDMPGMRNGEKAFPLGLERLTGRGFIVDFKNVPSDPRDFVRWYELLRARHAFFEGDCGQLSALGADYVVFRDEQSLSRLTACTELVEGNSRFLIARTLELS